MWSSGFEPGQGKLFSEPGSLQWPSFPLSASLLALCKPLFLHCAQCSYPCVDACLHSEISSGLQHLKETQGCICCDLIWGITYFPIQVSHKAHHRIITLLSDWVWFPPAWVLVQGSEESSCVNSGSKQQSGQWYLHIDTYNYTTTFAVGEGW